MSSRSRSKKQGSKEKKGRGFSLLRKVRSAPSLKALSRRNEDSCSTDASKELPNDGGAPQEMLVPITGSESESNGKGDRKPKTGLKRSVSFSGLNTMERIPSRHELLESCDAGELWFDGGDISRFAQKELSRRADLGITSTRALDSRVPESFEESVEINDDDMEGLTF
uniref:Uncharacterized protein n=1 Tax=Pseudictyota dubia TaxID=2749911 RepID=A0A7R9VUH5_9STRA|mmetsp:Transcript_23825/g.44013  ORF Transcript_23825/g.44013 Transcript_23825/m.44013 type:complete len:168 (+) Transcript_23825:115-618(+)